MTSSFAPHKMPVAMVRRLLVLLLVCIAAPAQATTIGFPLNLVNLVLPTNVVIISGASSDGANFGPLTLSNPNGARLEASAFGNKGSETSAGAIAMNGATRAGVTGKAGMNQNATAIAIAKAGTTLSIIAEGNSKLIFKIDPFLLDIGSAQGEMNFIALLDGSPVFSADAMLNDGSLITSGAFSPGDFTVQTIGQQTVAVLTNDTFSVPFDTTLGQVGQTMTFEFDQTFTANAQNGGTAIVDSVPEPSSLSILGVAVLSVLLLYRRRSLDLLKRCSPLERVIFP